MYPKELMTGIYWGFWGGKYNSQEEFVHSVTAYNKELGLKKWNANDTVLASSKATILYSYWDYDIDEEVEEVIELEADNETGFTAGELLYKVHNQVVEKLENESHHIFEGFLLGQNESTLNQPFYFIKQGL